MILTKISLEDALVKVNSELLYKKSLYEGDYKTISAIKKNHPELLQFFGENFFYKKGEEEIITTKKDNGKTLFSLSSIYKYNYYYSLFKEHYFTLPEAMISLNYKKKCNSPYSHIKRFIYMKENGFMDVILLDHKLDFNEYYVSKEEVKRFKDDYISYAEAANEAGISIATIKYWMKDFKKPIVSLHLKDVNFYYILRTDWLNFYIERRKSNYLSMESASQELQITPRNLIKAATEYNITYIQKRQLSGKYFKKSDIEFLKKTQEELLKNTIDNFYTSKQVRKKLNIGLSTLSNSRYKEKLNSFIVPPLISITIRDNSLSSKEKIFLKKDVDTFIKEKDKIIGINNILSTIDTNPFNVVMTSLKESNLSFSEKAKLTENYWKNHLKKKAGSTKASSNSRQKEIRVNFNTSKLLINLTSSKEIFMFSTKELIMAIFNSNTPISVKTEAYKFLRKVAKSRKNHLEEVCFDIDSIPNVYLNKSNKKYDKSIYSINQFIALIDYVKFVEKHKPKAIESIQLSINKQSHYSYDSSWLYVLLHLNNAWRHTDVTMFPRINLERTNLGNLDSEEALNWLKQNQLNIKEINEIVNQVSAIKLTHSKTKKRRYFFCSNELKSAFAHSVALCELRCRILTPFADSIINFNNRGRIFKNIYKKRFFAEFDVDFNFKSKQMNRTLISYIYSVITKMTNRNPLEVTKYIRSHTSIETTNIYIDIPQEQLDFITNQLFNLGHFGYAYDALSDLLLDNSISDREEKTKYSLMIKKVFGDVHQIEHLANYLKRLLEDQNSVKKVLKGYSNKEIHQLSNLIKLGQQPAKKEGFQCIYNNCPYPSRDCQKCPFAISHFYALSQLSEDFDTILNEFKNKFPNTQKQGEKVRLANNLYSYLHLISLAKKQFGEDAISSFFNQGLDEIKKELATMPSQKHLVTIPYL